MYWLAARNVSLFAGNGHASPTIVAWLLTARCNLKCKHCTYYLSRDKIYPDKLMHLADKIAASGCQLVVMSGGEPLIVPNIRDIIRRLKAADKAIKINTNGYNLMDLADFMIESKVEVIDISIDGPDSESHDTIRGKTGSFDNALEALKYIRAKRKDKPYISVRSVIMKDNWFHVPRFVETFKPFVENISFQPIHNIESHHQVVDQSVMFEEQATQIEVELTKMLEQVAKIHPSLDSSYYREFPRFLFHPETMKKKALHSCLLTWLNFLPINEHGTGLSCSQEIGNLYNESIEDMWNGNARKDFLRSISKYGKCDTPCWLNCTGVAPTWLGRGLKSVLAAGPVSDDAIEQFKQTAHFGGVPSG